MNGCSGLLVREFINPSAVRPSVRPERFLPSRYRLRNRLRNRYLLLRHVWQISFTPKIFFRMSHIAVGSRAMIGSRLAETHTGRVKTEKRNREAG
jgi:hypothetical protein